MKLKYYTLPQYQVNLLKLLLFIVIGALCLMMDAFYNGYPIVFSDTGSYIDSGFALYIPNTRPISYGLFIRLFSLNGWSLWPVIFMQAFILSYLIFLFVKQFVNEIIFLKLSLLIIILLTLFTGISWIISQIMADIFTSIALLCAAILLLGHIDKKTKILLYFIFFCAISMHMTHLVIFLLILFLLFLEKNFLFKQQALNWNKHISVLVLLTIATIPILYKPILGSKHIFIMGTMVERGIAKKYLDEYCYKKNYRLCAYKDNLPTTSDQFVWQSNSPLRKIGGYSEETKREFDEIIYATYRIPKYLLLQIQQSILAAAHQLVVFNVGDGKEGYLNKALSTQDHFEYFVTAQVWKHFNAEFKYYTQSKQNQSQLNVSWINKVYNITVLLSLTFLLSILLFFRSYLNKNLLITSSLFFMAIIINAWYCATFSVVTARFACKLIWLIPFLALVVLLNIRLKAKLVNN